MISVAALGGLLTSQEVEILVAMIVMAIATEDIIMFLDAHVRPEEGRVCGSSTVGNPQSMAEIYPTRWGFQVATCE